MTPHAPAHTPTVLRDLIYFDFDKAASISSQFEGGLLEKTSTTEDVGKDRSAGTKFGIPGLADAKLGVDYLQKTSILQSKTLHHDLLSRVDEKLRNAKLVADLRDVNAHESSAEVIRNAIGTRPYIRATGNSVLEDYQHILAISEKFNDMVSFIVKASQESAKKSPAYLELQGLIDARDKAAAEVKDRNERFKKKEEVKQLRLTLDEVLAPKLKPVDEWIVQGMKLFIDTLMSSRINFRIYPFPNCSSFQVLCNLKRECFVDSDLEHLLFGYGNQPNVPLEVFGLVTSFPPREPSTFNPLKEFEDNPELAKTSGFEQGFRGVFRGMEAMESMVRYSRYPNVTVHPIAVYRSFPIAE